MCRPPEVSKIVGMSHFQAPLVSAAMRMSEGSWKSYCSPPRARSGRADSSQDHKAPGCRDRRMLSPAAASHRPGHAVTRESISIRCPFPIHPRWQSSSRMRFCHCRTECEPWMSSQSNSDLPYWNKSVKGLLQSSRPQAKGPFVCTLFVNGRNWHSSLQAGFWNVYCPLNDSLIFNIMVGWSLILWLKMSIFTADWTCLNGKQFSCIENHINRSTYLLTFKEEGTLYSKAFQVLKLKMSSDD